jgi:hypothetical protein
LRRTHAQIRESAYLDPIFTAQHLILNDEPLPVDLQDELAESGIILEEFRESVLSRVLTHGNGYQLEETY